MLLAAEGIASPAQRAVLVTEKASTDIALGYVIAAVYFLIHPAKSTVLLAQNRCPASPVIAAPCHTGGTESLITF
jgi:hypothetical protein